MPSLFQITGKTAGHLNHPLRGRMLGHAEQVDLTCLDLYDERDIQPLQRHGVNVEEVDRKQEAAGIAPTEVVVEGDDIEKLAVRTPTLVLVLDRLTEGATPRAVVTGLIAEAMAAAEGTIPAPAALTARLARVDEDAEEDFARFGRPGEPTPAPRVCVLDPARPARDLLEDLLDGLRGCWLVYLANADISDEINDDEQDDDGGIDEDELSEEFFEAVRAEAAANEQRLL